MKFCREQLLLYGVTAPPQTGKYTLMEQIQMALDGGVTLIQLREKQLEEEDFIKEAIEVKKLCRNFGVPLIINDNVDVALRSGADGVHVGIEDTPVAEIRKKTGKEFVIGATAKTVEQAVRAQEEGADYLGVGAVFPSPTKPNAIRVTKEQLRKITASVTIPVVAIGGITIENMEIIKNTDAAGVAVVSAVFGAEDICLAAAQLKEKVGKIVRTSTAFQKTKGAQI